MLCSEKWDATEGRAICNRIHGIPMLRSARAALALLPFVLLEAGAGATSLGKIPPHNPELACSAIEAAVATMIGQREHSDVWPLYYSDDFGHVDYGERSAFVRSMTSAEGKADNTPIQITAVWPVGKREAKDAKALYIVGLQRDRWYPEREASFDPMQTEPAGYQIDATYWLAAFSGNRLIEFREGRYYFDLLNYDNRLKGCGRG